MPDLRDSRVMLQLYMYTNKIALPASYHGVYMFKPCLKCHYVEKMMFLFSLDSEFIFAKNAPCQLLRLNFRNKFDYFNYDFYFKLSAITRLYSRELNRERK